MLAIRRLSEGGGKQEWSAQFIKKNKVYPYLKKFAKKKKTCDS